LDDLKKEELKTLFEEVFYTERKLFESHVVCEKHFEENENIKTTRLENKNIHECESIYTLRRKLSLYPDYFSFQSC